MLIAWEACLPFLYVRQGSSQPRLYDGFNPSRYLTTRSAARENSPLLLWVLVSNAYGLLDGPCRLGWLVRGCQRLALVRMQITKTRELPC